MLNTKMKKVITDKFSWIEDGVRYVETCWMEYSSNSARQRCETVAYNPDGSSSIEIYDKTCRAGKSVDPIIESNFEE